MLPWPSVKLETRISCSRHLPLLLLLGVILLHAHTLDCLESLQPWIWATSSPVFVNDNLDKGDFLLPPRAQGADYFGPGHLLDINLHLYRGRLDFSQHFRALFVHGGGCERSLMLATQLRHLGVPYDILHIEECSSEAERARGLLHRWSQLHGDLLNVEVVEGTLDHVYLNHSKGRPFDYIDYYSTAEADAHVRSELRLVARMLRHDRGGAGITLPGSSAPARRSLQAIRAIVNSHGGLPTNFENWPDSIHTALQRACSFPHGVRLQPNLLRTLALHLRGLSTYAVSDISSLLNDSRDLVMVSPATPALYPGMGPSSAHLARGDDGWLSYEDETIQQDAFEYTLHELYVRRSDQQWQQPWRPPPGSPPAATSVGEPWEELWGSSTDLLVVPRTQTRLKQLKDAWRSGRENATASFGLLGPSISIHGPPILGASFLDCVDAQAAELPAVLHETLGQLSQAAGPLLDFSSFDRAFRGLLTTLLRLGWVSLLDRRYLNTAPIEAPTPATGLEQERNASAAPVAAAAAPSVTPSARGLSLLSQISNGRPIVVLYSRKTVFMETALGLIDALARLDVPALLQSDDEPHREPQALHIVLGMDFLSWLPERYIVFQLENLQTWLHKSPHYLTLASRAMMVWEFSPLQLDYWEKERVPALWMPVFVPMPAVVAGEDHGEGLDVIDVLFYGGWSKRRQGLMEQLQSWARRTGRVLWFQMDYEVVGAWREELTSRAMIVLNLHSVEHRVLEVHRINYLLAKGKCVVSERSTDASLDAMYEDAVAFTDLDGLEGRLTQLLADPQARRRQERQGQMVLAQMLNDQGGLQAALQSL